MLDFYISICFDNVGLMIKLDQSSLASGEPKD